MALRSYIVAVSIGALVLCVAADEPAPRFAVATMVFGGSTRHGGQDGYTLGAVALAGSVQEAAVLRRVDLVALVTDDVSSPNRGALQRASWIVRSIPSLEHVCFGFSKLGGWGLHEYARVLLVDADVVAARPRALLALLPLALRQGIRFAVAPDILPADRFNSGVMVIDPEPTIHAALLALAGDGGDENDVELERPVVLGFADGPERAAQTAARINQRRYRGDQDLLRVAFVQWWSSPHLGPVAEAASWPPTAARKDAWGAGAAEDLGESWASELRSVLGNVPEDQLERALWGDWSSLAIDNATGRWESPTCSRLNVQTIESDRLSVGAVLASVATARLGCEFNALVTMQVFF